MSRSNIWLCALGVLALSASAAADSHGKSAAEDEGRGVLPNTYQFGAPFERVDASSISNCRLQCDTDVRCDAWSYLPATSSGPATCEVKFAIGQSSYMPGAVSGISTRYKVTPIDMSLGSELAGGPNSAPSQPSAKPDVRNIPRIEDPGPAPRVYRGNELAGPANILTPPPPRRWRVLAAPSDAAQRLVGPRPAPILIASHAALWRTARAGRFWFRRQ